MALNEKIAADNTLVYLNLTHFADVHTWNGLPFSCVVDEDAALKRKNNNVVDISWDNNTTETIIYCREADFPGRIEPNEHGIFDGQPMKILQRQIDMGMATILLASNVTRAVSL